MPRTLSARSRPARRAGLLAFLAAVGGGAGAPVASAKSVIRVPPPLAFPALAFRARAYACDDGARLWATTVTSADGAAGLFLAPAASGAGAVALVPTTAADNNAGADTDAGARYATPAARALGVETVWDEQNGTARYSVGTGDFVGPKTSTCTATADRPAPPGANTLRERFVSTVDELAGPRDLLVQTVTLAGGAPGQALAFVTHREGDEQGPGATVALARTPLDGPAPAGALSSPADPWRYAGRVGSPIDPLRLGLEWRPTAPGGVLSSLNPATQATTALPGSPYVFAGRPASVETRWTPPARAGQKARAGKTRRATAP